MSRNCKWVDGVCQTCGDVDIGHDETLPAAPAPAGAPDVLRGFVENVQQIRGELWDAVSYVPVDSEAADTFARAARRAMERLDQLDGMMLAAIDSPPPAPDPDVGAAKIELESFEREYITMGGDTVDANAVADMLLAVHGFLSRRTAQPSPDVTDEDVRLALALFMAGGIVSDAALAFHGVWMRAALEQFAQRGRAPATREAKD